MKLLLDANLSPRLVEVLRDLYPGSLHVLHCSLLDASDDAIWRYAREQSFTIVSKDSDFAERSFLYGHPPKVIWLRLGNCTTQAVEKSLRAAFQVIHDFVETDLETCLILGSSNSAE
ncbi:putative nuclease of putative toxin-antitoxin system [Silvibacterium bohemicum]|uniref:Putative nuclease of putative toxin-antitoxin system n=1 Tax=Silvibacterium bohemicum TaxID=1577686 RepID=A0A841JVN0_9BACT|nr:DUF5615 family PIN-like protein [Silvibacterium bohemicum]MBB6142498.1 putative nuclease of putative toxin-antitoxin system [Silvibacterium bohemicum]